IRASNPSVVCISLMSTPALKPLAPGSARRMTTRTDGSAPRRLMVSANSNQPATVSALTGGLSMTTSAMPRSSIVAEIPMRSSLAEFLMDRQVRSPTVARLRYGSTVASESRVVLVTGGTRGIGRGICARFVADGATVVACGRNEPETPTKGVSFVAADVRDPDQVAHLIDSIADEHGRLDVVVNNAGGSPYALAADASPRFSTAIITLNLLAPMHVSQRANAVMQQQDSGGVIVNIGSVSGIRPSPGTAAYGAAKAGLINLTAT